nr:MAG TPA: hypothetical protein [Caudoviricetes sp.]
MLINVYGEKDTTLWAAADLVGAQLVFRGGDTYRVVVYRDGYQVGDTCEKRGSREWFDWIVGL